MKKYFNLIIASVLLMGGSSCSGFLDVEPTNADDASKAIRTAGDAQVAINGIQRAMTSSNYYGRNFIAYGDVKGGDVTIFSQGRGLDALYTFNHNPQTNSYSGFWTSIYNIIFSTNNLLENIEKLQAEGSLDNFEQAKAEALTIRALAYFDLVRLYGKSYTDDKSTYGVPSVLKTIKYNEKPARATVEDNYKHILNDLIAAEAGLPKSKRDGYLNYYANKAIQARVYLTMGDYDKALAAAETIINSKEYKLYENSQWVNAWKTQFSSESIYELVIEPLEADLAGSSLGFYFMRQGHQKSALGNFMAATPFLDALNADKEDVRLGVMSYDESSKDRLGSCYKYLGSTTFSGDKGTANYTAVNIKVIRLSEVYLIAAEAALKATSADKTKAATYAQAIHKRSPKLPEITAANVTEDAILAEKSKELFGEGLRYFDMIRLNKTITFDDAFGGISIPFRSNKIDRSFAKYILPISQDEILANPNIKGQQNPGYN